MNFLSHYYFNRYSRDPELVLGCLLPDLLKNADKDLRLSPNKHELEFLNNPQLEQIWTGWNQHIEIDKHFHNTPFFYNHTHRIRLKVAPALEKSPIRASFFSHIALELLLDHLLLFKQRVDVEQFYALLEAVDRKVIERFLRICGMRDPKVFFVFFDRFLEARYIRCYRYLDEIVVALLHICRRVWDFQVDSNMQEELHQHMTQYALDLSDSYMDVFDDLSAAFPPQPSP